MAWRITAATGIRCSRAAAYQDFGTGSGGHAAQLNYAGCFSHALAVAMGEPLLLEGDDFSQTDLWSVLR
ncbi:MAG: type II toxin-antitoxin system VapC family toxin [Nocardioidaceae bacterium]|nr:type II toxin-antitoxin system VapC family toxin [Nocardioidaceae bacterium]